jgi:hypothetical protein
VTPGPFEPWHDFFVVAGTAGVTLLGLVFVAVSLNTGIIMRSNERHLRVQAVTSFEALLFTAVLSLIALAPMESVRQHGVMLITFGVVWFLRSITHLRTVGGAGVHLRRRLLLPAAAYAVVAVSGVQLMLGARDITLFWISAVLWLVITATRNAWSLLVDVGEVRVEEARRAADSRE